MVRGKENRKAMIDEIHFALASAPYHTFDDLAGKYLM